MKRPLTCRFTCVDFSLFRRLLILLLISLAFASLHAQQQEKQQEKAPLFSGVAIGADVVGFAMKAMNAKFANMEVSARINLCDKYFPVAELGIGDSHREGAETGNTFSTTAPYLRFGLDYNFNKKHNGNRLFGIVRYVRLVVRGQGGRPEKVFTRDLPILADLLLYAATCAAVWLRARGG